MGDMGGNARGQRGANRVRCTGPCWHVPARLPHQPVRSVPLPDTADAATRTAGQPDSQSAGQPDSRTAGQPVSRTASQPDSRTAGQPDSRTAGQPVSRTASQPAARCTKRRCETRPDRASVRIALASSTPMTTAPPVEDRSPSTRNVTRQSPHVVVPDMTQVSQLMEMVSDAIPALCQAGVTRPARQLGPPRRPCRQAATATTFSDPSPAGAISFSEYQLRWPSPAEALSFGGPSALVDIGFGGHHLPGASASVSHQVRWAITCRGHHLWWAITTGTTATPPSSAA